MNSAWPRPASRMPRPSCVPGLTGRRLIWPKPSSSSNPRKLYAGQSIRYRPGDEKPMLTSLDSPLFFAALGVFFITASVFGITGKWKRWYWTSRKSVYLYLPIGVLFLLATLGFWVKAGILSTVLQGAEIVLLGIAIWWVTSPPGFLKPAWIRTIEAHPKSVYDAMVGGDKKGRRMASEGPGPRVPGEVDPCARERTPEPPGINNGAWEFSWRISNFRTSACVCTLTS